MSSALSRKLLQGAIAIGGCVPVSAGLAGALGYFTDVENPALVNHFSYLSGILFAIGIAFWSCIPNIEAKTVAVRVLTFLVFIGGVARLIHSVQNGFYPAGTLFALCMELVVTPLLCVWQYRLRDDRKE